MQSEYYQQDITSVEGKIRHIIEDIWQPDADYMFYNWAQANVMLDGIRRPVIMYVLPSNGNLYMKWHQTCDEPQSQIAFLCNTEFDFKTRDNDALMQRMKTLAAQFLWELNKSGLFQPIDIKTRIPYQAIYDHLDQNVTGIMITVTLKEVEGIKICQSE